jgi:hypothetical protein
MDASVNHFPALAVLIVEWGKAPRPENRGDAVRHNGSAGYYRITGKHAQVCARTETPTKGAEPELW